MNRIADNSRVANNTVEYTSRGDMRTMMEDDTDQERRRVVMASLRVVPNPPYLTPSGIYHLDRPYRGRAIHISDVDFFRIVERGLTIMAGVDADMDAVATA